jgi:ribosome biogenesis GTPase A
MFLLITKQDDEMCNVIKNLLFSKNIPYYEIKNNELPHQFINILLTRFEFYPMLLEIKQFSSPNEQMNFIRNYNNKFII